MLLLDEDFTCMSCSKRHVVGKSNKLGWNDFKQTEKNWKTDLKFFFWFPGSSRDTASSEIYNTIFALLQDELLLVKVLQCFSAEPVSQQSQSLTLLHCDMSWHAVTQPQRTTFEVCPHAGPQATAASAVVPPEKCAALLWGVCVWFCTACVLCLHSRAQSAQLQYGVKPPKALTCSTCASLPGLSHSGCEQRSTELQCSRLVKAEL